MEVDAETTFEDLDDATRAKLVKAVTGEGSPDDPATMFAMAKRAYESSLEFARAAKKSRK